MIDPMSPTWKHVARECERLIQASKDKAVAIGLSHDDTQVERGRVSAFKAILDLAEAKEAREFVEPPIYGVTR